MDNAIPWYKSHALWGCAAAIVIAAFNYFHVVLPDSWTKDHITSFFTQAAPIMVAIWGRVTAQSVVVGTPSKAARLNAPAESELELLAGYIAEMKAKGASPVLVAHLAGTLAALAANELSSAAVDRSRPLSAPVPAADSPGGALPVSSPAGEGSEEAKTSPTSPADPPLSSLSPSAAAHL